MKLCIIAGVRPQFIKLAALQRAIINWNRSHSPRIHATYLNSGQHHDKRLSEEIIDELDIQIDVDITPKIVNVGNRNFFGRMVKLLSDEIRLLDGLDWVIVIGDTKSTIAGAIAATRVGIPIAHIEAGLRSDKDSVYEFFYNIVVDHLSTIHFLTSENDESNLEYEGLTNYSVWVGDLVLDLLQEIRIYSDYKFMDYETGEYILSTIHHRENICSEEKLRNILFALNLAPKPVVFPCHPNTKRELERLNSLDFPNIDFIDPLSYLEMLKAIRNCAYIVTDSGGIQREAYYLGKRCLVRQDNAFWSLLIDLGVHYIVGYKKQDLVNGINLMEKKTYNELPKTNSLGDGKAGERIIEAIVRFSKQLKHEY